MADFVVTMEPIERVIPYARNPRKNAGAIAKVAAAIKEFGWRQPIVVDPEFTVIVGHTRLEAARQLGFTEVPVHVAHGLTPAQVKAYRLADNRVAEEAEWDADLLALELQDLSALGDFDLSLTGFDDVELAKLLDEPTTSISPDVDVDDVPEPPKVAVTQVGDVIRLGRHVLVCGDARDPEVWDRLEIGEAPSMVFTSPPYGLGKAVLRDHIDTGTKSERESLYAGRADDPQAWPHLMHAWTSHALARVGQIVCNVQQLANNKRAALEWLVQFGGHLVDIAVWDKGEAPPPQMQRNVLNNAFEWLVILSPKSGASRAIPLGDFHGTQSNVLRVGPVRGSEYQGLHDATMPVAVAQWAVDVCGAKAVTIVDPFGGTGTTLIACEVAGKAAKVIELEPIFCDVIVERWERATGAQATRGER